MGAHENCGYLQNISPRESKKKKIIHQINWDKVNKHTNNSLEEQTPCRKGSPSFPAHLEQPSLISQWRRNQTGTHWPVGMASAGGSFPWHKKSAAPGEARFHGRAANPTFRAPQRWQTSLWLWTGDKTQRGKYATHGEGGGELSPCDASSQPDMIWASSSG